MGTGGPCRMMVGTSAISSCVLGAGTSCWRTAGTCRIPSCAMGEGTSASPAVPTEASIVCTPSSFSTVRSGEAVQRAQLPQEELLRASEAPSLLLFLACAEAP